MVDERIIRTFCWHSWERWSEPFQGVWTHPPEDQIEMIILTMANKTHDSRTFMSQRRECRKCGKVRYRKCT